jgi:hypothetical protein
MQFTSVPSQLGFGLQRRQNPKSSRGLYIGMKAKAPEVPKAKALKAKPVKKVTVKKRATKATATDKILKIVNASKKGVDIATIKKKTGFADKKIRNIIFRANKEGKIQTACKRTLYRC